MEKKIALALLSSAALASSAVMAQTTYVGVAAGTARANLDCTGVSRCDNSGTAAKLTGGYTLGNGLAIEFGYLSFGKISATDAGVLLNAESAAITVGMAFGIPMSANWGFNFRTGVASVKTKLAFNLPASYGKASSSETNAAPYVGLGLSYALSKTVKLEAALDASRIEFEGETGNVRALTAGLRFDF